MRANILEPPLAFDRNKPFYPLVINYLAQFHGFLDLTARGILSILERRVAQAGSSRAALEQEIASQDEGEAKEIMSRLLSGGRTAQLVDPLKLPSRVTGQEIKIGIEQLALDIFENNEEPIKFFNRMSAGALLILAWELTEQYHTHDPIWEFLRHCRNAIAHSGHFNFLYGEPKRPADWKHLSIVATMQGQSLFPDPPAPGFIHVGDVLYLLADIEQTI